MLQACYPAVIGLSVRIPDNGRLCLDIACMRHPRSFDEDEVILGSSCRIGVCPVKADLGSVWLPACPALYERRCYRGGDPNAVRRRIERFPDGIDPYGLQAEVVELVREHAAVHGKCAGAGGAVVCEFPGEVLLRIAQRIEEYPSFPGRFTGLQGIIFSQETRIFRIVFIFCRFC